MKKLLLLITLFTLNTHHLHTQWIQQTVPVNKPITGIKFIDSSKGWACTGYGSTNDSSYILYATNSGANWLVQLSVYNIYFTDINMLNSLTGYVSGYDLNINRDKLFSTTNGGVNWTSITMVPNMAIDDMQFLNKDSAWECGNSIGPDVRTTTDGGNTWIVRTSGLTQSTQKIFFLNYNTGFCGAQFNLYKTTNAGLNWVLNNNFSEIVSSIFFLNVNTGWIGASNQKIYFTSNAGANWVQQPNPGFGGTTTDIYFINSQTGWAGNRTIYLYKTTNGGQLWGYQRDTSLSYRISIIDSLRGWTADNGISRTINGGGPIIFTGLIHTGTTVPTKFILYQNYPNPFNPLTTIKIDLPEPAIVNLIICDMLGKELETVSNEYLKAGSYEFIWDASEFSSGIYFYRLTTDNFAETKKMILIK